MSTRAEFLAGVKAELPLLLGVAPFGLIYGVLARKAGIPGTAAVAMSSIVLAGSAQFIATQMFASGAPALILLLTTFVVNLRHMLYSASVAPYLRPLRPAWRWLLPYLLTDEAYAVTITRYATPAGTGALTHWFFLGAGLTLWIPWQITSAIGVYLGTAVPPGWDLEFALPVIFIAIVVPMLGDRAALIAGGVAAVSAVAAAGLPLRLGLIAGAGAGILAGLLAERSPRVPEERT